MNASQLKFAMTTNGGELPVERIGCVIWWSADDVRVDPVKLKRAMVNSAPQHADLVRLPAAPRQAMRRAMARRQGAMMGDGWRWEVISDNVEGLRIALAESHRDAANHVYEASTRLDLLVLDSGQIVESRAASVAELHAINALRARYDTERDFLTQQDLRDLMTKVLLKRSHAVRLKSGGAVYFVPSSKDDVIDAIAPAVKLAGIELMRFPVSSMDGHSIGQLAGPAQTSITDEAAELRDAAKKKLEEVKSGSKKARAKALADKLEDVEALRAKARLYKMMMSIATDDIETALRDAESAVRETMDAIEKAAK